MVVAGYVTIFLKQKPCVSNHKSSRMKQKKKENPEPDETNQNFQNVRRSPNYRSPNSHSACWNSSSALIILKNEICFRSTSWASMKVWKLRSPGFTKGNHYSRTWDGSPCASTFFKSLRSQDQCTQKFPMITQQKWPLVGSRVLSRGPLPQKATNLMRIRILQISLLLFLYNPYCDRTPLS